MNEKDLIGLSEIDARKIVTDNGFKLRVIRKDGKNYAGTCDLNPNRFNIAIENGIITEVWIG